QPRRLLEFEIGGGGVHALFQIGDDRLEVGALVMERRIGAGADGDVILFIDAFEDVGDGALDALGRDAVGSVVGLLPFAPAIGLADGGLHTLGHVVGIEDDAALDIARRPADRLDEGGARAQIALLVGVEDGNQRAL